MRRIFLFLVISLAMIMGAKAQELTATLQQNGTTTVYYGSYALRTANYFAEDGAIITLSKGCFDGPYEITKQISIVGNCGENGDNGTRIETFLYVGNKRYSLIVNADNVKIEGIYAYRVCLASEGNISNCHISHSTIDYLRCPSASNDYHSHTNTIIDQCIVGSDSTAYGASNYCYKNSFIKEFFMGNYSNTIYFTNCLIERYYYYDYEFYKDNYPFPPYGTYKNCILGQFDRVKNSSSLSYPLKIESSNGYLQRKPYLLGSNTHYYKCLFYIYPYKSQHNYWGDYYYTIIDELKTLEMGFPDNNYDSINILMSTYSALFDSDGNLKKTLNSSFKGDDGKVIGPYGGEGFTLIPSIPRITQSTIGSYTNGEGKLDATIKVEVNP